MMHTSVPKPKVVSRGGRGKSNLPQSNARVETAKADAIATKENGGTGHDFAEMQVDSSIPFPIQKKMIVNAPGDAYEQEADRFAEQVTHAADDADIADAPTRIRHFEVSDEPAPPSVKDALASPGSPLSPPVKEDMEQRFGHDFSQVRVHSDGIAERSSQDLNAHAYTVGRDLVFGSDKFAPETPQGQRLLAHELTHVIQQTGLTPGSMPIQRQTPAPAATKKENAPAQGMDTATESSATGEAELSPLRQELFNLFEHFEKKVVGDPEFDDVETKKAWDDTKDKEKKATEKYEKDKAAYDAAMIKYNKKEISETPKMPIPVAKFTTCIATQQKILEKAFTAAGVSIKKEGKAPRYAFATEGAKVAEKVAPEAWHWGKMGTTERPQRGDIIVMAFRGSKVDEAAKQLNYIVNIKYGTAQKRETKEKSKAKVTASQEAVAAAQSALETLENNPKHTKWQLSAAKTKLEMAILKLNAAIKAAETAEAAVESAKGPSEEEIAPVAGKLEKARKESAAAREQTLKEPVGSKKRYLFQFSHVGFLQKREPLPDGRERWTTFDGGQLVEREGERIEGAQTSIRYYDPKTNEISGELQQGGEARWLYGWVNVDKLVAKP